jgi:cytochrome b
MPMDVSLQRPIYVWDAPTRLFHWTLAFLIVVSWFTGEGEGVSALVHRAVGALVAGLIVFRFIWGFVGGEHARFADFAFAPAAAARHLRDLAGGAPARYLGHNPLGAIAVYLLLANIAVIVATGLFSAGEGNAGPFAAWSGANLSELHEGAFRVLQVLVSLHLIGVVVESVATKDALARAMITGMKHRGGAEIAKDARRAGPGVLFLAAAAGLLVAMALLALSL